MLLDILTLPLSKYSSLYKQLPLVSLFNNAMLIFIAIQVWQRDLRLRYDWLL